MLGSSDAAVLGSSLLRKRGSQEKVEAIQRKKKVMTGNQLVQKQHTKELADVGNIESRPRKRWLPSGSDDSTIDIFADEKHDGRRQEVDDEQASIIFAQW